MRRQSAGRPAWPYERELAEDVKVKVVVHGHAREYFPDPREEFEYEFTPGERVADMLAAKGIKKELIMRVVAEGASVPLSHELCKGETIILLTPMAGG